MDAVGLLLGVALGGLVVGGLARFALPGPDPMSIWATMGLGVAGSLLGGIVGQLLFDRPGGFLLALVGAVVLLALYRRFVQHRPLTGPEARAPRR